jgi:RNase P subunit RPR2
MGARESVPIRILLHPSSSHVSPKSVELKLGAKEPLMKEAKRCELKLPMEIKRTACIRCRGHGPTGAITSRYPVKEEKVSTPV